MLVDQILYSETERIIYFGVELGIYQMKDDDEKCCEMVWPSKNRSWRKIL